MTRRGFALLTALWALAVGGTLAAAAALVGRDSADGARNRAEAERAMWRAEDCLAHARSAVDAVLAAGGSAEAAARSWRTLDASVAERWPPPTAPREGCSVELRAAGSGLDPNAATPEQLWRLFASLHGAAQADALTDALLDWRDADDDPAPHGAERQWYRQHERHPPRNDTVAHVRELARLRGYESLTGLDTLFMVDGGRISIANAPAAVLAAVPGFLPETVEAILERRLRGEHVADLLALGSMLSEAAADSLLARFPDISRLTVLEPEAWLLTSRGTSGAPAVSVGIEVRLVREGHRALAVRRRGWL